MTVPTSAVVVPTLSQPCPNLSVLLSTFVPTVPTFCGHVRAKCSLKIILGEKVGTVGTGIAGVYAKRSFLRISGRVRPLRLVPSWRGRKLRGTHARCQS
jgi:hypothetical protein